MNLVVTSVNASFSGLDKALTRFWVKIDKTDTCWLWIGGTDTPGYGRFWDGTRLEGAHRWSYLHFNGEIPADYDVDHLCKVRLCVNPKHLEAVTRIENLLRANGVGVRNAAKTHCPQGHEYSEANTYKHQGKRRCKICSQDRIRQYRNNRKGISD